MNVNHAGHRGSPRRRLLTLSAEGQVILVEAALLRTSGCEVDTAIRPAVRLNARCGRGLRGRACFLRFAADESKILWCPCPRSLIGSV